MISAILMGAASSGGLCGKLNCVTSIVVARLSFMSNLFGSVMPVSKMKGLVYFSYLIYSKCLNNGYLHKCYAIM